MNQTLNVMSSNNLGHCSEVLAIQLCPTLHEPMDCSPLAPLCLEFSRQEYWSGQPFPYPGNLPHPGIEPGSPALQADSLPSEPTGKPRSLQKDSLKAARYLFEQEKLNALLMIRNSKLTLSVNSLSQQLKTKEQLRSQSKRVEFSTSDTFCCLFCKLGGSLNLSDYKFRKKDKCPWL